MVGQDQDPSADRQALTSDAVETIAEPALHARLHDQIRSAAAVNVDETGWRLSTKAAMNQKWMGARNDMNLADVLRWGFMPTNTHVQSTEVPDLGPWATPFWRLTASALLLLAVAHGVHGLVVIADDYIVSDRGRLVVRWISIATMISMSLIGLYVLWTA